MFMLLLFLVFWVGFVYMITNPTRNANQSRDDTVFNQDQANGLLALGDYITPTLSIEELTELMRPTLITYTPTPEPSQTATIISTATPEPTRTSVPGIQAGFGMQVIQCVDCASYEVLVRLTNYWPDNPATLEEIERGKAANKFGNERFITTTNCWKFDLAKNRCVSAMESELPWHVFVGWAAACPYDWPDGTVIHVQALGRTFWCLDRGTMVCAGGVCDVDILALSLPQNGGVFNAIIQVPGW